MSLDSLLSYSLPDPLPNTDSTPEPASTDPSGPMPKSIDRYRIVRLLGEGGYGRVYEAIDEQLQRRVAIKVPLAFEFEPGGNRSGRVWDRYLEEARTLAKLDHPHVVAIHDVGVSSDGKPYIVSAFVDGTNLAARMATRPLTLRAALRLLIEICDALDYVHAQGIVHRDVKPGNILLDEQEHAYLVDFGLALHADRSNRRHRLVGTPHYMSPEQARGESHLVDGRSDLFGIGIILYEMLTGKRPFSGRDAETIQHNLIHQTATPPRQFNSQVPVDLERICMKCLAKKASQRYATARDLSEDLRHHQGTYQTVPHRSATDALEDTQSDSPVGITPRGLRSYDRHDADFFMRLLPGPLDRHWVPESLRFWQRQLDGDESHDPPRVGILYGPSGCGKSSFVKAGLLPLLRGSVDTVFIEATHDETEKRLLRGILKKRPQVENVLSLAETLESIRQDESPSDGRRLLLVIDQFEQWLHGRADQSDPPLVHALRQCDGHQIQCLLLVRDDFWLALSRFMSMLEVKIEQDRNATLVDLFSLSHAQKVLADLGVAYGRLPVDAASYSPEQRRFIKQAVQELNENGKVFPVRLALFVEMVKDQPWVVSTLNNLGGVKGIGVRFLDDSFSSEWAPAAQRTHEIAVRNVLRLLLPDHGVAIKGNMQPKDALLDASGYENEPARFSELLQILDKDLRLITPTDPAGSQTGDDSLSASGESDSYYQLTHDYLVPAIDQWLTRRQRQTRRGRAELRLAEYASLWSTKPSPKLAPSWLDWLTIRLWSSPDRWNKVERQMMQSASKFHLAKTLFCLALIGLVWCVGWKISRDGRAKSLVQQLQTARDEDLPGILQSIQSQSGAATPFLDESVATHPPGTRGHVVNQLGLLQHNDSYRTTLLDGYADLNLGLLMVLGDQLDPLSQEEQRDLISDLRSIRIESTDSKSSKTLAPRELAEADQRNLKAALLLATIDAPEDSKESHLVEHAPSIVRAMLRSMDTAPQDNHLLVSGLQPVSTALIPSLREIATLPDATAQRSHATSILFQFLNTKPQQLIELFVDLSFSQQESMFPAIQPHLSSVKPQIHALAFRPIAQDLSEPEFDAQARRKGIALALLPQIDDSDSIWPMLRHQPWPHTASYLIHRLVPFGASHQSFVRRFARETLASTRCSLLHILGQYDVSLWSEADRLEVLMLVQDAYQNDPDPGVHSSADWALRKWGYTDWLNETDWKLSQLPADPRKNWYVNPEGQTMIVLDARNVPEIGYVFEIASKEVTVSQYKEFKPEADYYTHRSPTPDCPIGKLDWFDAVSYCRWLNDHLGESPDHAYPADLRRDQPFRDYAHVIKHSAYRLPTTAEWLYACRALTTSTRYYGWSSELAEEYYSYYETSSDGQGQVRYFPGGKLKPNAFGLFSLYDGIREWGHNDRGNRRPILGGSNHQEREATRLFETPSMLDLSRSINGFYGLRLARTRVSP